MTALDSWQGAIVRHRDGRKGLVLLDVPHRWTDRALLVHWDNDQIESAPGSEVTMLKPPLGYRTVAPPAREPSQFVKRFGPVLAFWPSVLSVLVIVGIIIAVLTEGAW